MKTLPVSFHPYTENSLMHIPGYHKTILRQEPAPLDIRGNVILTLDDVPVLMRMDCPADLESVVDITYRELCAFDFPLGGVKRLHSGAAYVGTSWGTTERRDIRKRMGVQMSSWSYTNPGLHRWLTILTAAAWRLLASECYEMWYAMASAPQAFPCWRIGGTPYTSGVINVNARLPYHKDRGNVADTGSAMWTMRRGVKGGHLHIPSLNAIVRCGHGSLVIFYGEKFWHGVTGMKLPSQRTKKRISIVTYAKQGILKAGTPEQENKLAALRGTRAMDDVRDTVIKYQ